MSPCDSITGVFTWWTKRIAERSQSMSMMPPVVRLAVVLLLQVVVVDRHVVVADEIGDARPRNRRLEARRLRDDPVA